VHRMLWILMLSAPFRHIANTAGWMKVAHGHRTCLLQGLCAPKGGFGQHRHVYSSRFVGMYTVLEFSFCSSSAGRLSTNRLRP